MAQRATSTSQGGVDATGFGQPSHAHRLPLSLQSLASNAEWPLRPGDASSTSLVSILLQPGASASALSRGVRAHEAARSSARAWLRRERLYEGNSFTADEEALVERIAIAATATVASAPGGAERNAAAAAALVEADAVFTFLAGDDNALNDELNADVVDALCVAVHAASVSVLADIDEVAATVLVDDGWLDAAFTVADEYATRSNDSTRRRVFSRHGFVGAATYCARFRDMSADDRSKFLSLRQQFETSSRSKQQKEIPAGTSTPASGQMSTTLSAKEKDSPLQWLDMIVHSVHDKEHGNANTSQFTRQLSGRASIGALFGSSLSGAGSGDEGFGNGSDAPSDDEEMYPEVEEPPSLAKLSLTLYMHNAALQAGKLLSLLSIVFIAGTIFVLLFRVARLPLVTALALTAAIHVFVVGILATISIRRIPQTEQELKKEYEVFAEKAERYRNANQGEDGSGATHPSFEQALATTAATVMGGHPGGMLAQLGHLGHTRGVGERRLSSTSPSLTSQDASILNAAEEGRMRQSSPRDRSDSGRTRQPPSPRDRSDSGRTTRRLMTTAQRDRSTSDRNRSVTMPRRHSTSM
ncbi:hypothetical protein NFJ02_08g139150 [Pycnococcus provasolii]